MYTADENLNDIEEVAPACRRRGNVFAHSWGLFSQLAATSVGRHTCPSPGGYPRRLFPDGGDERQWA